MKGLALKREFTDNKNLRIVNLFISAASLLGGIIIYIIFKNNEYLSIIDFLNNFKCEIKNPFTEFLKNYFADFLWAFSFCSALISFWYKADKKSVVVIGISVSLFGILFEVCQLFRFVKGTFDFMDILMYCSASVMYIVLNIKILKN